MYPKLPILSTAFVILYSFLIRTINANYEVVYAVNCGGPAHVDLHGVEYAADPLEEGIASDYGLSFTINRIPMEDQIIYQTERYNTANFAYTIPCPADGDYVLILKFSEVWFSDPDQKVFHVLLNNKIPIVEELDIFAEVGFATALERYIPIRIHNGVLSYEQQSTRLDGNAFSVDFIKTDRDNPKVNAIVLAKGSLTDIPVLPPLEQRPEVRKPTPRPDLDEHEKADDAEDRSRRPAGSPRAPDPYSSTDYSDYFLPILGSVAAFVPLLICLCRL